MNKQLALIAARRVCRIGRQIGPWYVVFPTTMADPASDPSHHACASYPQAVEWCAQAVARVALLQIHPDCTEQERLVCFAAMRSQQILDTRLHSDKILDIGLAQLKKLRDANAL